MNAEYIMDMVYGFIMAGLGFVAGRLYQSIKHDSEKEKKVDKG